MRTRLSTKAFKATSALLLAASSCFALSASSASAEGQRDNLPGDVEQALESFGIAFKKIRLEYRETVSGESIEGSTGPIIYLDHFDGGRFYHRKTGLVRDAAGRLKKGTHEDAFDGKVLYAGEPDSPVGPPFNTLVKYSSQAQSEPLRGMSLVVFPFLDAMGVYAPTSLPDLEQQPSLEPLLLRHLRMADSVKVEKVPLGFRIIVQVPDPVLLDARASKDEEYRKLFENQGVGAESVQQALEIVRRHRELTPKRIVSFLLDSNHGCGVLEREERTADGRLILKTRSEGWKFYDRRKIWLPSRTVSSFFTNPLNLTQTSEKPLWTVECELLSVDLDPKEPVRDALSYEAPGTVIRDRASTEASATPDHEITYTIAANGNLLKGVVLELAASGRAMPEKQILIVRLVLLAAVILPILIWYFGKRHKTEKQE